MAFPIPDKLETGNVNSTSYGGSVPGFMLPPLLQAPSLPSQPFPYPPAYISQPALISVPPSSRDTVPPRGGGAVARTGTTTSTSTTPRPGAATFPLGHPAETRSSPAASATTTASAGGATTTAGEKTASGGSAAASGYSARGSSGAGPRSGTVYTGTSASRGSTPASTDAASSGSSSIYTDITSSSTSGRIGGRRRRDATTSGGRGVGTGPGGDGSQAPPPEDSGAGTAPLDDPSANPNSQSQTASLLPPYVQYLNYYGTSAAGGFSLAAAAQAAFEVQQAALRKRVQRDIRRMLAGSKAYQHHVKGAAPAMTAEALQALAQPKKRPGPRPEAQALANAPDPVEWARLKTEQLVISRMTEERRQAELAEEKQQQEQHLAQFRQRKIEAKLAKAEAKARAAAEEAAYRANMSAYLNHKGQLDLEDFRRRKEDDRERLALARSRQARGLSAHHY